MRNPLFEIVNADVFIPGARERMLVLRNISWHVDVGEHTAILGPNGSGKSSLLKLLHGDLWPGSGSIAWFNEHGDRETSRIAARDLTAIVSPVRQEMLQRRPWGENVSQFLQRNPGNREVSHFPCLAQALEAILARNRLIGLKDKDIRQLSQGQLRLVLLAEALWAMPRILLLDEFADSLDVENRRQIYNILDMIRDKVTIIFASHHPEKLPTWCVKRLFLNAGEQVKGTPPNGADKVTARLETPAESDHSLFMLTNVSVYINRQKILNNIDWTGMTGEHWQICGANGSGKSTFLRLLAGEEFAAADGQIRRWYPACQRWVDNMLEARKLFVLVSDLTQIANEYPQTALELILSGFDNSIGVFREFADWEIQKAMELLREYFPEEETGAFARQDIRRLSTGQLRRLYLARAMILGPAALLLDEPLNGLDRESRRSYLMQLQKLASREKGRPAIIIVSHEADELPDFIHHKAEIVDGRLTVIN